MFQTASDIVDEIGIYSKEKISASHAFIEVTTGYTNLQASGETHLGGFTVPVSCTITSKFVNTKQVVAYGRVVLCEVRFVDVT